MLLEGFEGDSLDLKIMGTGCLFFPFFKRDRWGFPGGPVVKNLPFEARASVMLLAWNDMPSGKADPGTKDP